MRQAIWLWLLLVAGGIAPADDENGRLKRLVADLSLDRQILQEIVSKKL
jgi:hypothetical protein